MPLIERAKNRLRTEWLNRAGPVIRQLREPPKPRHPEGLVWVHLGCGELDDKRFINVDARPFPHVHHVTQSLLLDEFPESSIDLIYCCHVLEHVSHRDVLHHLKTWQSKLKPQGTLRISVPDFDKLLHIYKSEGQDINSIQMALMGGQEYPTNCHFTAFTTRLLSAQLTEAGFSMVQAWQPKQLKNWSFDDWAGRDLTVGSKQYPVSLNLEATKLPTQN